ncbi:DMT(Drug/metabolite transporter) superfamily permease [Mesotoga infera]|uniref:DMT(Drug/metabolite transporter) superfamily permease n=1 Tax=Mesotoga infera TaxID=1236046 RepID=A0A7Z7PS56_9BACT|nr:DMT family transporter [Mesotoga infera]SSC14144.1 DMT(Drug/metabolite transporter) superfamily permease [Mesotoga infera]
MSKIESKAYVNLLLVVVFWGLTFPMQKDILHGLSPVFYNVVRFSFAILLLIPLKKRLGLSFFGSGFKKGVVLGLFLSGGYVFQTWGLVFTSASKSAFITALYVAIVAILSPLIERKIPTAVQISSLAISLIGLYFLTSPDGGFNFGDFLTTICALSFALHVVLISHFTKSSGDKEMDLLLPQFMVVVLVNLLLTPFVEGSIFIDYRILLVALFTAVFATIFAVVVQLKYQRYLGSVGASLIYVGEPAFALLFAMIILGESPSRMEIVGLSLMTLGMVAGGTVSLIRKEREARE